MPLEASLVPELELLGPGWRLKEQTRAPLLVAGSAPGPVQAWAHVQEVLASAWAHVQEVQEA